MTDKKPKICKRQRGAKPETVKKYQQAAELYATTSLTASEICRQCGVTESGLKGYLSRYHRELLLARYGITCQREEAVHIKMGQLRGQLPATRLKYQQAIEACGDIQYIKLNLSEIARKFGLEGSNLNRQLRTHYPDILKWREKVREIRGLGNGLPKGTRTFAREQYAKAVELLQGDAYLTLQEVAESCGVSYTGLEQHLIYYHKDLVKQRIRIRKKAVQQKLVGEITGRGTRHAPSPASVEKYAKAVELLQTTTLSAANIARQTGVNKKALYEHLQKWHKGLLVQRKKSNQKED